MSERATWLLYECLSPKSLADLIQFQWKIYGFKLALLSDAFKEVEGLEEIDRLMRQPTRWRRLPK